MKYYFVYNSNMRIKLAKSLTTVTTFSKFMALMLFILLPLVAFKMGMEYGALMERCNNVMKNNYSPKPDSKVNNANPDN